MCFMYINDEFVTFALYDTFLYNIYINIIQTFQTLQGVDRRSVVLYNIINQVCYYRTTK